VNIVGRKVSLETTVEAWSHGNNEIGGACEIQFEFSTLLGPFAGVIGSVEFVPFDLVGRYVDEVHSPGIWEMLIVKSLGRGPCNAAVTDDYVGHEALWQYWLGGENEQF
jgi:hypothetical protein